MSSVFSNLKPVNHAPRNGFDLSRRSVFSTKCGQILPVFVQATLPDSEYRIDVKQLLRTQPLQTAAFTGFSINYDFFFVPNNYSYSSFNEFISQREDSRHVGQPSIDSVPRFSFKGFMRALCSCCIYDYLIQTYFTPTAYKPFDVNYWSAYTPMFLITSPNIPTASVSLEVLRSLDMLGYGNYLPLVKSYVSRLWHWFKTENPDSSSYVDFYLFVRDTTRQGQAGETFVPDTADKMAYAMFYLCDTLDEVESDETLSPNYYLNSFPDVQPTLWPALAYNKAFYEFYRNSYYDMEFVLQANGTVSADVFGQFDYVQLFNFDDWNSLFLDSDQFWMNIPTCFTRLLAIFVPKNHLYKRDLFTGVLPSTQFGDISLMVTDTDYRLLQTKILNANSPSSSYSVNPELLTQSGADLTGRLRAYGPNTRDLYLRFDPALTISVLEQRRADAMQRFKERMLRAGNKVKDVFKAHGWSEPYSATESNPIFLGTFDGRLDINTVAATSSNDDTELGQLGANGVGVVNGSKIHFKCHDFGCIVGVLYIVKDAEYDAYGIERQHCLTDPFDYPYPELQNISLAPIDTLELSSYLRFSGVRKLFDGDIIGYLPRFMEYKTAVDKVHGEFYSQNFESDYYSNSEVLNTDVGVFSDWVAPRFDLHNPTLVSFLYQQPNIADNIFKVASNALQSTDQFLINALFDCMAVEPVSVIGLPI